MSLLTDESKLDKALDGWVFFSLIVNKITTLVVYPYEKPQVLIMKSNLKSFCIFGWTTKYLANTFISLVTLCTSVFALENVLRKNFVFRLNGESRGFDAEKAGISNGKNGSLNGGHVGPLPPDGMSSSPSYSSGVKNSSAPERRFV